MILPSIFPKSLQDGGFLHISAPRSLASMRRYSAPKQRLVIVPLALHPPIHTDAAEPVVGKKHTAIEPAIADKEDKATVEIALIDHSASKLDSYRPTQCTTQSSGCPKEKESEQEARFRALEGKKVSGFGFKF